MFDRIRELKKFFQFLADLGLDLKKLKEVGEAAKKVIEAVGVEAKIRAAAEVLVIFTEATKSPTDDKVAALVKDIVDHHLDWILELVGVETLAAAIESEGELTLSLSQEAVEARGLDFSVVMQVVMLLVEVVRMLSKRGS